MANNRNYYEVLGVEQNASEGDIKKAYYRLALENHPDKGGDVDKFKEISNAYETLKDVGLRRHYDNLHSVDEASNSNDRFERDDFFYASSFSSFFDYAVKRTIKARLYRSGLPADMVEDLAEVNLLSITYKNKHPVNEKYESILSSLVLNCNSYIDAVATAYKENPTRYQALKQSIVLTKNVLQDPSEENIQKSRDHAKQLSYGAPKALKEVGVVSLLLTSFLIALVGVTVLAAFLGALLIPANPVSVCLTFAGIGLIMSLGGAGGMYGGWRCAKEVNESGPRLVDAYTGLNNDIERRAPKR